MSEKEIPVLLIIYDRFDTASQVISVLRSIGTTKVYISCDGPHKPAVANAVEQCREQCVKAIDWPCTLTTSFRSANEGPRYGVGKGISWFFENESVGMILEHDCVPHPDFFTYCGHFLTAFENQPQVMHIGANSYKPSSSIWSSKNYFSKYNHIWGFATWARAWKMYDVQMSDFNEHRQSIENLLPNKQERNYWMKKLNDCFEKKIDSWDYPWTYAIWKNRGISLLPPVNMVKNIGFGEASLNSKDETSILNNLTIEGITSHEMLQIPETMEIDLKTSSSFC